MSRKILFIVNPNAGKKISGKLIETIRKEFPSSIHNDITIWKDREHFHEIIESLKIGNYTDAVAVGGDGTVNQVAKTILNTGIKLGIVPAGSGNGLARSLGISVKTEEAIKQIAIGDSILIDSGTVNGIPFFCTSGVGFDAHIGRLFATSEKRGLKSYVKISLREFSSYKPKDYKIIIDGKELDRKAFLITVANAGQYGNNFYIAPQAKLNDGLFHIVILKPFNLFGGTGTVLKVLRRKANEAKLIETFTGKEIFIKRAGPGSIHFDGEPQTEDEELHYILHPKSLKVIVGNVFDGL
ncbi:MAG TPA: YegS/Rv2252/BmrU family lipid kinase [Bacteroidia bacterium]|jgi:diacylglycerol kinase (ATP)|nr:YegS/Rv2252/BmrU family lipid kinase [Bacteroidia bacterium]